MHPLSLPGVPGLTEVVVILMIGLLLFGVPLILLLVGVNVWRGYRDATGRTETALDERIAELEDEVDRLRNELEDRREE